MSNKYSECWNGCIKCCFSCIPMCTAINDSRSFTYFFLFDYLRNWFIIYIVLCICMYVCTCIIIAYFLYLLWCILVLWCALASKIIIDGQCIPLLWGLVTKMSLWKWYIVSRQISIKRYILAWWWCCLPNKTSGCDGLTESTTINFANASSIENSAVLRTSMEAIKDGNSAQRRDHAYAKTHCSISYSSFLN